MRAAIRDPGRLAPLHNPVAVEEALPGVPVVAVFDTSFHRTIPDRAALYALPLELSRGKALRRYGAHGTSHQYVAGRLSAVTRKGKFIDPRYLKEQDLTDRDLSVQMPAVGAILTIPTADDEQTILCIVDTEAAPKKKVREAIPLRVCVFEGRHYLSPLKAPHPKTGVFTPWILRTRTD